MGWGRKEGIFIFLRLHFICLYSVSWGSNDELEPSLYLVLMQFTGIKWQVNNPCSQHDGWGKPPIFFFVLFLMFCDLSHLSQKPIKKNRSPLSILSLLPSTILPTQKFLQCLNVSRNRLCKSYSLCRDSKKRLGFFLQRKQTNKKE